MNSKTVKVLFHIFDKFKRKPNTTMFFLYYVMIECYKLWPKIGTWFKFHYFQANVTVVVTFDVLISYYYTSPAVVL